MTHFVKPVVFVIATTFAVVGPDVLETHVLNLPTVVAVVISVASFAWWLSHKFTVIDDQFAEIKRTIAELPCPRVVPKIAETLGVQVLPCDPPKDKPSNEGQKPHH